MKHKPNIHIKREYKRIKKRESLLNKITIHFNVLSNKIK